MARIFSRTRLLLLLMAVCVAACLLVLPLRNLVARWFDFHLAGKDATPLPPSVVVASGEVDVQGGILPLSTGQAGVVKQVHVNAGQAVTKCALLASLDPRQSADQVAQARARQRGATLHLAQAKAKVAEHDLNVRLAQEACKQAQARVESQEFDVRRLSELVEKKQTNPLELEAARATLRGFQAAHRAAQFRKELVDLENPELEVQLAQADLDAAQAALDSALAQQDGTLLKAPEDGVVLRVLVQPGRPLQSAEPAVWFQPNRPWVVRCDIDQQFINQVAEQMPCDICEDRGEAILGRGRVEAVGVWVAARRVALLDESTTRRDARTVECVVALSGTPANLRIGQRVRVIIHTDPEGRRKEE
jgi:multidrug resistance efflux pump